MKFSLTSVVLFTFFVIFADFFLEVCLKKDKNVKDNLTGFTFTDKKEWLNCLKHQFLLKFCNFIILSSKKVP